MFTSCEKIHHIMAVCISSAAVQFLYICWLFLQCAGQTTKCHRNRVISNDAALLSAAHNITAFRDGVPSYPLRNITKAFWCAHNGYGNYVSMTFSKQVVIEGIISSGATSNDSQVHHFVSDFTLLHSKTVNGPLQLYSAEDFTALSSKPKYTYVDSLPGLRFQFRINKFQTDTIFCWGLRIIGCTLDNAVQDPHNSVTTCPSSTTQPYSTTLAALLSSTVQHTSTSTNTRSVTTVQFVTITVKPTCATAHESASQTIPMVGIGVIGGGAAVLLVGVVMIVSAAVLLCIAIKSMKRSMNRQSTVSNVDNFALYRTSSSHDENTLSNKLQSDDTAGPEYATLSNFQPSLVAIPNQSYLALDRNW